MHKQSRQWSVSAFCMVYLHHYDQQVAMANVQGSLHPKSLGRNDCLLALWERINCQAQARQSAPMLLHRWEDRKPQLTLTFLICVSLASQSFFKLEILIKDTNASNQWSVPVLCMVYLHHQGQQVAMARSGICRGHSTQRASGEVIALQLCGTGSTSSLK